MRPILLTLLTLTTACSGDKDDTGATAFTPTAGEWRWDGSEYQTDTCNAEATLPTATLDATLWDLTLTEDGFELDNAAWTADPIRCTLEGTAASCTTELITAAQWPDESNGDGEPDATYTTTGTIDATFSNSEESAIELASTMTCEGADCDAHAAAAGRVTPCETSLTGQFILAN
ncbi:MAG: hypothetical protein VX944_04060 [Myxococcota bacterium]|nr:hypothetical protein [Myxococcota bacterium]MEC9389226.1 hypothetical protein [Myxococcota bacterium]